ncbi:MAG: acetylornithine deacetylase, partial [Pseudomonadota bacterium]
MAVIDADVPAGATASTTDILAALVAFDTTSRNSNLPLVEWVEDYLSRYGVESERVYDATGEKANLWATIGPADAAGIVLSGHTDVVPVDGQDWASDPFTLTERDGKLYGRGSADMKGFLAACLAKVPAMVEAPLEKPIHLAFSYDEEVGCQGVLTLVAALKDKPLRYEACIVGEPTSMGVVTAHKTTRRYRADFTGLACHSSLAPQGVSAVSYAARLVAYIDETAARLAAGPQDELFDLPHSTANVGIFSGGTALNIVPASASVDFEYRMLPQVDLQAEHDALTEFVAGLNEDMAARDPSCGATLEMIISVPGLDTSPDAEVVTFAKRLAGRNDHAKVAFGTEAGSFSGELAIPTVVLGPGAIAQAHKADEFIAISQLTSCERV